MHPANPKKILLSFGDFTPGTSGALAQSDDFCQSWKILPLPQEPNSTMWTFGTNSDDPNVIFAASRYGYLYRSDDGGEIVDEVAQRIERDRGGVLVAELARRRGAARFKGSKTCPELIERVQGSTSGPHPGLPPSDGGRGKIGPPLITYLCIL